ncbi:MAG: C-GCAxxG-C-C family protein [Planctomycetota bacterium]
MTDQTTSRRDFITATSVGVAAASALGALGIQSGHAEESGNADEKPGAVQSEKLSCGKETPEPGAGGVSRKSKVEEAHILLGKYANCCTAVLAAYAPELGMERDLAVRATRGMPGIGLLGNVCGAISGATLAIGLKTTNEDNIYDTEARHKTCEIVRAFVARFEERHSSIKCRDLLGHDISTRAKLQAARKADAFANCPRFVESAVSILDEVLDNERTQ